MTEPRRFVEGAGGELAERLLRAGASEDPERASLRKTLVSLGLGTATVTATTASAGAAASFASRAALFSTAKWIGGAALVATVGTIAARQTHRAAAVEMPSDTAREIGDIRAPAPTAIANPVAPLAEPAAVLRDEPPPLRTVQPSPRVRNAIVSPAPSSTSLREQIVALDAIRRTLEAGDAAGALAALDRYAHDFPKSMLAPEAIVVRIEALLKQGDRQRAAAIAHRFVASHPESPHVARIQSLIGSAVGNASMK
jgi:hypothetical protein